MTQVSTASQIIDFSAAAHVAALLAPPGPRARRDELNALVSGLHEAAHDAVGHVLETTLMTPLVKYGEGTTFGRVMVVDRATWARANTQSMAVMVDGINTALMHNSSSEPSSAVRIAGAVEMGSILALLSGRVLGQFDPYSDPGRLLLIAPNVLQVERAMDVSPRDFRLWVCLHEQTHALQFAAAPWLSSHLSARVQDLFTHMIQVSKNKPTTRFDQKIATIGRNVLSILRGESNTLTDMALTHELKAELHEITAVMALLEGHADVMMDAVGPQVVPSVRQIRDRFERRREGEGQTAVDAVLRKLLGMDAKLAQYRDGAAFVRSVERIVGRDGLNAAWAAPENLPTAREMADARAWVRRVHG